MNISERYVKNTKTFSRKELEKAAASKVAIVGCGGLGGYVVNVLARFGVGNLTLIDGDVFNESNLNRQLFAVSSTIGKNKALATKNFLRLVNDETKVTVHEEMLTDENAVKLLKGHDIVVDCLDNIPSRWLINNTCKQIELPFVHGAIGGFFGQVAFIKPGDKTLDVLYPKNVDPDRTVDKIMGTPPFTPQIVASIQACEVIKYLCGKDITTNRVTFVDLSDNSFYNLEINEL